jgi:hypothetical protein
MLSLLAAISFSMPMLTTSVQMQCDFKEFSVVFERTTNNHSNFAFTGSGVEIAQFASERTFILEDESVYVLISMSGLIVAVNPATSEAITNNEQVSCYKIARI